MVAARRLITEEEFAQIDAPGRYDLVDGELWSTGLTELLQSRCATRFTVALCKFVEEYGVGEVLGAEVGFVLDENRRTILCPDVGFVRSIGSTDDDWTFVSGPPDIAVEVISDSEQARDIQIKVGKYLAAGTSLVWCVYPNQQQVVVHKPDQPQRILSINDTLTGEPALPGFQLSLANLFRPGPS